MPDRYQPLRDAIAAVPRGWGNAFDEARKHPDEDGIAQVGGVDEDQRLYPVIEVNCDEYYGPEDSLPLARYISAAKPKTIAALFAEREALREALDRIHGWLAGYVIATPVDMAQSFPDMERIARAALARTTGEQQ